MTNVTLHGLWVLHIFYINIYLEFLISLFNFYLVMIVFGTHGEELTWKGNVCTFTIGPKTIKKRNERKSRNGGYLLVTN